MKIKTIFSPLITICAVMCSTLMLGMSQTQRYEQPYASPEEMFADRLRLRRQVGLPNTIKELLLIKQKLLQKLDANFKDSGLSYHLMLKEDTTPVKNMLKLVDDKILAKRPKPHFLKAVAIMQNPDITPDQNNTHPAGSPDIINGNDRIATHRPQAELPSEMIHLIEKITEAANEQVIRHNKLNAAIQQLQQVLKKAQKDQEPGENNDLGYSENNGMAEQLKRARDMLAEFQAERAELRRSIANYGNKISSLEERLSLFQTP